MDGSGNWLKLEEAAHLLRTSVNTLRRRIKLGQLRVEKMPRPQGYTYRVFLPEALTLNAEGNSKANLEELVELLRQQLAAKDQQIGVLLELLRQERGSPPPVLSQSGGGQLAGERKDHRR